MKYLKTFENFEEEFLPIKIINNWLDNTKGICYFEIIPNIGKSTDRQVYLHSEEFPDFEDYILCFGSEDDMFLYTQNIADREEEELKLEKIDIKENLNCIHLYRSLKSNIGEVLILFKKINVKISEIFTFSGKIFDFVLETKDNTYKLTCEPFDYKTILISGKVFSGFSEDFKIKINYNGDYKTFIENVIKNITKFL